MTTVRYFLSIQQATDHLARHGFERTTRGSFVNFEEGLDAQVHQNCTGIFVRYASI